MTDTSTDDAPKGIQLSSGAYDILKDVATIILPAIAVFYAALAGLWHFPFVTEVVGTISAVVVLLGTLIKITSVRYAAAVKVAAARAVTAAVVASTVGQTGDAGNTDPRLLA